MSTSADEHYRYVSALEEQNAEMRAQIDARNVTIKSIAAENRNLREQLKKAGEATDELHRELDLSRHALRVVRGAVNEHRNATIGGEQQHQQHADGVDTVRRLRESASY